MFKRYVNELMLLGVLLLRYLSLYLLISISVLYIPFFERFSYLHIPEVVHGPFVLGLWGNFDGVHYLEIAREGYHGIDRAFFPLYPSLLRILHTITGLNLFYIGLVVSNVFFILGLFLLNKFLQENLKISKNFRVIIMLLAYPSAFFFSAVYTESLFFFLVTLSLYLMPRKKPLLLFLVLIMSSLCRIQGVFLMIPLFFSMYIPSQNLFTNVRTIFARNKTMFAPILGLALYMCYLYFKTGDPLYFLSAQSSFGAQRSTHIILLPQVLARYLRIFFTASWNFQYFIAIIEFVMFSLSFVIALIYLYDSLVKKHSQDIGLALFSLANLLLPTLTGTLSSMPRYSLFAFSTFIVLARIPRPYYNAVILAFITLQGILFAFFAQGYFVS